MKLFLLTDRAVLFRGRNLDKVCVVKDGEHIKTDGVLTIGALEIPVADGYGDIPKINAGNYAVTFTADGKTYDGGLVAIDTNGDIPYVDSASMLDSVLTEATKVDGLARELARLADQLTDLKGKVEYQGLDFITGKGV